MIDDFDRLEQIRDGMCNSISIVNGAMVEHLMGCQDAYNKLCEDLYKELSKINNLYEELR